jgi:outer membrane murein-binding lipoprotein Lpp
MSRSLKTLGKVFKMIGLLRNASTIGLITGALLLGGCATQEAVEKAQASADQAMAQAQTATSSAHRAQGTADSATSAAQVASADAQKANTRLDTAEPNIDHIMHHHEHGTWKNVGVKHASFKRMPKIAVTPASTGGQ